MSVSQVKLGAVFVGWITCVVLLSVAAIAGIGYLVMSGFDLSSASQNAGVFGSFSFSLLVSLIVFISFFIGGYVAGRMAAYAGPLNGALVVATNVLIGLMIATFIVIVGNKMGIDAGEQLSKALNGLTFKLFALIVIGLVGSILGGRYGEGYIDRLDLSLGLAKPGTTAIAHPIHHAALDHKQSTSKQSSMGIPKQRSGKGSSKKAS